MSEFWQQKQHVHLYVHCTLCNSIRARRKIPLDTYFRYICLKCGQNCSFDTSAMSLQEQLNQRRISIDPMNGRMLLKVGSEMQREIYRLCRAAAFTLRAKFGRSSAVEICRNVCCKFNTLSINVIWQ